MYVRIVDHISGSEVSSSVIAMCLVILRLCLNAFGQIKHLSIRVSVVLSFTMESQTGSRIVHFFLKRRGHNLTWADFRVLVRQRCFCVILSEQHDFVYWT